MLVRLKAAHFIRTRATLIARLKNWQDNDSWEEFVDLYWRLIYSVARNGGLTDAEAQDVGQETLMAVARNIPTFEYDPALGSFKSWLLNMARWRIIDQLRKRGPLSRHRKNSGTNGSPRTATIEAVPDLSLQSIDERWEVEWRKNLLQAAEDRVKQRLDPEKYQVFDCYVNKEWPPSKVAATFGLSVGQVYVAKCRISQLIKDEVARLEKKWA